MKNIEAIQHEATINKWPYPKTFDALKEAGVWSYYVEFEDRYHVVFEGESDDVVQTGLEGFQPLKAATMFSEQGVKQAIQDHMAGKTNYLELLSDLSQAGVSHYTVDMDARTIFYYNPDESQFVCEQVPEWKE